MHFMRSRLILAGGLLSVAFPLYSQHGSTTRSNPFDSPGDRAAGAHTFKNQCAGCHGPGGQGGSGGPNLTTGNFTRGDSDDALFRNIGKGIPGTNMPGFAGSPQEVWQLAAYVRSISVARVAKIEKGDAGRGEKLFAAKGCAGCHMAGSRGGNLGPDLTRIGNVRPPVHLRRSILDPDQEVSADYWQLRAKTKAGVALTGIRLNEDTFSYQYRDKDRLRSVLKSDLTEHQVTPASMMPPYRGKLSDAELDDLVAFLALGGTEKMK